MLDSYGGELSPPDVHSTIPVSIQGKENRRFRHDFGATPDERSTCSTLVRHGFILFHYVIPRSSAAADIDVDLAKTPDPLIFHSHHCGNCRLIPSEGMRERQTRQQDPGTRRR